MMLALIGLGMVGGFLSGLLGLGGGIIMLPLLTLVPVSGGNVMAVRSAVGVTMLQSLSGSCCAMFVHRSNRCFDPRLALLIGGSAAAGSLAGAVISKLLTEAWIAALFAALAAGALMLMLLPERENVDGVAEVSARTALAVGSGAGVIAGIVGQGGAFFLLPLMIRFLRVPVRVAIGTTAAVSFLSAMAGFAGKWVTGQVPLAAALYVSAGAILGAQAGGRVSHLLSPEALRRCLVVVLLGSTILTIKQVVW